MQLGVGHLRRFLSYVLFINSAIPFYADAQSPVPVVELMDHRIKIETFFNTLSSETLDEVDVFYDRNIHFEDPVLSIHGRSKLKAYYSDLYRSVDTIHFEFSEGAKNGLVYFIDWTMKLKTQKLNSGDEVKLRGCSQLRFDSQSNKVIYHRDYFDLGAFVYEHVPIIGSLVRFVKSRLRGDN